MIKEGIISHDFFFYQIFGELVNDTYAKVTYASNSFEFVLSMIFRLFFSCDVRNSSAVQKGLDVERRTSLASDCSKLLVFLYLKKKEEGARLDQGRLLLGDSESTPACPFSKQNLPREFYCSPRYKCS